MKTTKTLIGILTITTALLTQAPAQSFLTDGLIAYYPFNGNANDESGNTNDGTVYGATLTADQFANSNTAFSFNGIDNYIEAPASALLNTITDSITISAWVYVTAGTTDAEGQAIVARRDFVGNPTGERSHFQFVVTRDFGIAFLSDNNQDDNLYLSYFASPTNLISLNQWSLVSATFTNGVIGLYLNGNSIASTNLGYKQLYPYNQWLNIGRVHRSGGQQYFAPFHGNIDEVRIYNRALSDSEVQQLYAYESGPRVDLIKAVKPLFKNLTLTTNYQLQVSADMSTWTNQGSAFTATNASMLYPQYFDVDNWGQLFFRLHVSP